MNFHFRSVKRGGTLVALTVSLAFLLAMAGLAGAQQPTAKGAVPEKPMARPPKSPAADAAAARTNDPLVVPGFWDPRHRPDRPDLSRIGVIRFLTETDYPPFDYAGPDGAPDRLQRRTGARDLRRDQGPVHHPDAPLRHAGRRAQQARGRRHHRLARRDAADAQAGRLQQSLLPHAGALRGACAIRR